MSVYFQENRSRNKWQISAQLRMFSWLKPRTDNEWNMQPLNKMPAQISNCMSCHVTLRHVASCYVMSCLATRLRGTNLWAGHSVSAFSVLLCDDLIQQTRVEIHEGIHKMHVGGIDEELALVTEKSLKIKGRSGWFKEKLFNQLTKVIIVIPLPNN